MRQYLLSCALAHAIVNALIVTLEPDCKETNGNQTDQIVSTTCHSRISRSVRFMKPYTILITIVALLPCSLLYSQDMKDLEKLVETEKAFADMARKKSVRQAFLEFFADDGVLFQPAAVNGKKHWKTRPESAALLAWNPVWADISSDGSIGYTTGDWEFRPKGKDDTPVAFGQYITIWKKQSRGEFKAVLDIGISHAKPAEVKKKWASPKKTDLRHEKKTDTAKPKLAFFDLSKYDQTLADDVRLYRELQSPLIAKQNAMSRIKSEQAEIKSGRVFDAKSDGSEDFLYHYGILELTKTDDSVAKGNLLRIWKRRNDQWQIVLEVFMPIPVEKK